MHFLYKIKLYHQNMWVHFDPISLLDSNHIYGSEQLTKCAFEKPNARIHTYETASSFLSHKMSKQRQIDLFKRIFHFYDRQMQDSLAYFCHVLDFRCLHHQKRTGSKLWEKKKYMIHLAWCRKSLLWCTSSMLYNNCIAFRVSLKDYFPETMTKYMLVTMYIFLTHTMSFFVNSQ